jgi:hypothetical protein
VASVTLEASEGLDQLCQEKARLSCPSGYAKQTAMAHSVTNPCNNVTIISRNVQGLGPPLDRIHGTDQNQNQPMDPLISGSGSIHPSLHSIIAYYSILKCWTDGTSIVRLTILHNIILLVYFIIFFVYLGSAATITIHFI